ncbi:E3 ubiquitin-protein ligase TM129-like [Ruditapes philippinarum]|uniref:E3 ubiquitin-protein ligase TM129-like n=1 Tax=Ruditapes philippinarum TaxID=129788 RepID=UPI00295B214D|nr:E3 ubiquitin-protein ligase TM129-like [Ruditapes philippinarum]
MAVSETNAVLLFTCFYLFFAVLLVAPPTEFISAGLTIQNVFSNILGSEDINFIYYHIRRTSITLIFHSSLPLCYYIVLGLFAPELQLFTPWLAPAVFQLLLVTAITLTSAACLLVFYWSRSNWDNHPIAKELGYLGDENSTWRAVAASINIEFRRIDKFSSGIPTGRRVIVTDSWVIKTSTYFVHVAHQNDIHLTLAASEEHNISYENMTSVQFVHIDVASINPKIAPFSLRLNSLDYRDLKEKLQAPVRNARCIVIRQSLSEQFLQAFAEQVSLNPVFIPPDGMEVDTCIGCMQKESDIKLQKHCSEQDVGECVQCYCRPMWCLECMGKWFASRQDQQRPDTWLSSRSPCPTCRAVFCILDVCKI